MAKKATITDVSSGYASGVTLDANFDALNDAFDNTLSLDGSTPNQMTADIDLNSNDLLNVNVGNFTSLKIGGTLVSTTPLSVNDASELSYDQGGTGSFVRTVEAKLQDVVYAEDFGAVADGSTDSAAAINEAITHVTTNGGVVHLRAGTYIIETSVILKDGVILVGQGVENTILKLKNSTNTAVVQTEDYDTLTGQNENNPSDGVPYNLGLVGMTIDGNKSNQSTAANCQGVELYAGNVMVDQVYVRDCLGDGWRSEKGTSVTPDGSTQVYEGAIKSLWCGYNGGVGMRFRGPNDQRMNQLVVFQNDSDGVVFDDDTAYSASHHIDHIHSYANDGYGVRSDRAIRCMHLESSNNGKAGLYIDGGFYHHIVMGRIYGNCRLSGSYQIELLNPSGHSIYNFLVKDNEKYRAGVSDLFCSASYTRVTGDFRGDNACTGKAIVLSSTADFFSGDVTIQRYNGVGAVGIETGETSAVTDLRLNAIINNCTTGWVRTNGSARSIFNMSIYANAGQTVWSGTAFSTGGTEYATITGYDTDAVANVTETYGKLDGILSIDLASGGTVSVDGTQVLRGRLATWAAPTGTSTRSTFATSTVTTEQLAERVKAIYEDLASHGLIGTP